MRGTVPWLAVMLTSCIAHRHDPGVAVPAPAAVGADCVNGAVRLNADPGGRPPVFFREVVPAGEQVVQAIARLDAKSGYKWQVPFSRRLRTDGVSATCIDVHLDYVADRSTPLGRRPQLRVAAIPLSAAPRE